MSWIEKLCNTYDKNAGSQGLIPLFHTGMNAHILVLIGKDGNFRTADLILEKADRPKIIPCTERSSARTSGPVPHPLFDSLQYLAGDVETYAASYFAAMKASKRAAFENAQKEYLEQLKDWCDSPQGNPFVRPVLRYLEKKTLTADLIRSGILPLNPDGSLMIEKPSIPKGSKEVPPKIFSILPGDLFKAFIVFELHRSDNVNVRLFEDASVRQSWLEYSLETAGKEAKRGLCQVYGKEAPLATLHPKRIRNAGDGAKLISGNDGTNFTYRGRFESPLEASAISIEATQKAHSALRWLIEKQGYHDDTQYIVAWAVDSGVEVPQPVRNTAELSEEEMAYGAVSDAEYSVDTAELEAKALARKIAGYKAEIDTKQICVMMLDSATPGTLAVKSYRELEGWRYLDHIRNWHENCAWHQYFGKDKVFDGAPAPREIVWAAYGDMKMDDPRMKSTVARLLPCIIDARPLPKDIVDSVVRRTSSPSVTADSRGAGAPWSFRKNLGIACGLYRYYKLNERKYTMSLDRNLKSRDYLYGRLLGVADYLEYCVLTDSEKKRPTNAMRLMSFFSEHPFTGWATIHNQLLPYQERMRTNDPGRMNYLDAFFQEIHGAFTPEDFCSDKPLSGEYLLGYYCQKGLFFTKKADSEQKTEN